MATVGTLRFIQKFGDGCRIFTQLCDECTSRAVAMWAEPDNTGRAWCANHAKEFNAPEPTPGIEYASTMALMAGWTMVKGVPTLIDPGKR